MWSLRPGRRVARICPIGLGERDMSTHDRHASVHAHPREFGRPTRRRLLVLFAAAVSVVALLAPGSQDAGAGGAAETAATQAVAGSTDLRFASTIEGLDGAFVGLSSRADVLAYRKNMGPGASLCRHYQ